MSTCDGAQVGDLLCCGPISGRCRDGSGPGKTDAREFPDVPVHRRFTLCASPRPGSLWPLPQSDVECADCTGSMESVFVSEETRIGRCGIAGQGAFSSGSPGMISDGRADRRTGFCGQPAQFGHSGSFLRHPICADQVFYCDSAQLADRLHGLRCLLCGRVPVCSGCSRTAGRNSAVVWFFRSGRTCG